MPGPRSTEAEAQDAAWSAAADRLLAADAPFEEHWETYQQTFAGRAREDGPPLAWTPTPEVLDHANLSWLAMAMGVTVEEVHGATVADRERFWELSLERLGIRYDEPPERILEGGAEDPVWLPGARLNAAAQCFLAPSHRPAIIAGGEGQEDRVITYAALKHMSDQVSHGLRALGLGQGDGVALYLPMNVECVAAYLGIVQAGMVVVSIPDSFAPDAVASRLRLGGAKAIITVDSFLRGGKRVPMATKAIEAAETAGVQVISIADDRDGLRDGDVLWSEMLRDEGPFTPVPCAPDDVTNVLFSSGTTGEPKAIPWTHLTPLKSAIDGHWHQDIHAGDVVAWPTNIGWMMGPWLIYASLVNHATMVLYEGVPTSPAFVHFLREHKVTMLGLVPAIVRAWRENGTVRPGDLPDVRVFSSTGEASNAFDYLYLMSLAGYKAPVIEYCGGTEIGGGHITGTVTQPASPATFTTPAMGLDFVILDDDDQPVPEGGMGEIYIVPPSLGLSQRLLNRDHHAEYYEGCPKGPDGEVLRRHGDEIERLFGGFYAAQGRADDTMNLGGIKVGSIELERAMNAHEDVSETAAVAVPPEGGGADRLVVFAVTQVTDTERLRKELQALIKEHLNPLFRIHDVVVTEALPRTASNKVMRRKLRDQYRTVAV